MHFANTASGTAAVLALVAVAMPSGPASLLGSFAPRSLPDMESRVMVAKRDPGQLNARADLAHTGSVPRLASIMARTADQSVLFPDMEGHVMMAKRASSQLKARGIGSPAKSASPGSPKGGGQASEAHVGHQSRNRAQSTDISSGGISSDVSAGLDLDRPVDRGSGLELSAPPGSPTHGGSGRGLTALQSAESPSHSGSGRELTAPRPAESPSLGDSGRIPSPPLTRPAAGNLLGSGHSCTQCMRGCFGCFSKCFACCKTCPKFRGQKM